MNILFARAREISGKVRKKGLAWGWRRLLNKSCVDSKALFGSAFQFLLDIRSAGLPSASANRRVESRFKFLLKESYRYSTLRRKAPYPVHAHIEVTSLCNLNCSMCPRSGIKRPQGTMSLDNFKRIIDKLAEFKLPNTLFLHFSGEPLLNPDLAGMISYAKKKGLPWIKFNTNAVLLDEERAKQILDSGLDCMVCAVEMSEEQENLLRPGADYKKVVANVRRFMELKRKLKKRGPLVKLQMLVSKDNAPLKKKAYAQWRLWVDRVDFHPLHTVGGLVDDLGAMKLKRPHCEQLWVSLIFLWNGDVVPCCFNHDASLKAGNIFESSLKDIWNSEKLETLRREDKNGSFNNPVCKRCMSQGVDY